MRIWTFYSDFGNAFIWSKALDRAEVVSEDLVGGCAISYEHIDAYFPVVAPYLKGWSDDFECLAFDEGQLDWDLFHRRGLYLASLIAEMVAKEGILCRYTFPCEDPYAHKQPPHILLHPENVSAYLSTHMFEDLVEFERVSNLYTLYDTVAFLFPQVYSRPSSTLHLL